MRDSVRMGRWRELLILMLLPGCAFSPYKPCAAGGEPARDLPRDPTGAKPAVFRGTKQCHQYRTQDGVFVNHGQYREWHVNGKLALEGEYRSGRRHGKWIEYDDVGKTIGERWFEEGQELPPMNPVVAPSPLPLRR